MGNNLKELHSIPELELALTESGTRPVLLFKHSTTCPVSSRALGELQSYLKNGDPRISYKLITVQTARSVSNEVAAKLELEHHTPQAIIVRNGRQVWNASHSRVTASALEDAIRNID